MGEIQEVSPTQKVIPQAVLDDVLNNFSKVLTQARMVPNITEDNKTDGFKIFQIKPDSIYEKLGLKDNDIIKRVNGQDLDNFEKATGLFTALRNEKTISIDVVRNGTRLNWIYEIR
jgi:general secretion pathway protein C